MMTPVTASAPGSASKEVLGITLLCREGQVAAVRLQPRRRLEPLRLLTGCRPEAAAERFTRLFAVCGAAQGWACRLAVASALGEPLPPPPWRALVQEAAREQGRRLCLDLPLRLGLPADPGPLRAALGLAVASSRPAGLPAVLETPAALAAWAAAGESSLAAAFQRLHAPEWAGFGAAPFRPLPSGAVLASTGMGEFLRQSLLQAPEAFAAAPAWSGLAHETGPLAAMSGHPLIISLMEQYGSGLLTRFAARLLAWIAALEALAGGETSVGERKAVAECTAVRTAQDAHASGSGLAMVETARGLLLHHARLEGRSFSAYTIVAPTEWNFHQEGCYASGIIGAAQTPELLLQAELLAVALDPCVAYDLVSVPC